MYAVLHIGGSCGLKTIETFVMSLLLIFKSYAIYYCNYYFLPIYNKTERHRDTATTPNPITDAFDAPEPGAATGDPSNLSASGDT